MPPRRKRATLSASIVGLVAALAAFPALAQTPLKKVRIAYGGHWLVTSPWLALPGPLGFWRQEGLEVELLNAQGSLEAVQLLVGAQADLVQINSAPLVQAATNNGMLIRDVMLNTTIDWSLVVPQDSPIKTIRDIKGKSVGTAGFGGGGTSLLKSLLQANGLDPDRDITVYATGPVLQAAQALRSNKVQGLFYWGSAIAALEDTGLELRSFTDPDWRRLPGYSLAALHGTVARDPKLLEGLVRGAAKASLFALTNPDCARRLRWASNPGAPPTGAGEAAAVKTDLRALDATLGAMKLAFDLSGVNEWGKSTPEQFARLQDILLRTKQISKKLANPADYVIAVPDFFKNANAFDHDAVVTQAKACDAKM
jgi:NitT/TauT family transport system substrate-binding protein